MNFRLASKAFGYAGIAMILLLALAASSHFLRSGKQAESVTVKINCTTSTAISPYIYGANFPDWKTSNVPYPLMRQGGNRLTAYNWVNNASNAGNDYHNQNDGYLSASNEPGIYAKTFLEEGEAHHAAVLLTVPMAGHVAADKSPAGDVNHSPNYLETRFKRTEPRKGSPFTYPPAADGPVIYEDEFVHWIDSQKKPGTKLWFALDNEPDIWSGTHSRIVPKTPTYAEFIARSIDYASAIKDAAPDALIFGPVSYGWQGYQRFQNASDAKDRNFLDVYLTAMHAYDSGHDKRLLDVLDIHYYPEAKGGGERISMGGEDKPGTAEARMQAPRSLWDSSYVEDSWITQSLGGKSIDLLPRIKGQIAAHYPGTKLGITEYDFGGGEVISGAIAEADVLGIFGRYGVFAACHWVPEPSKVATLAGFRSFLNFDGHQGKFGDLELELTGVPADKGSVYAALDSQDHHRLTLVVINKTSAPMPFAFELSGFKAKTARGFKVTAASLSSPATAEVEVEPTGKVAYDAPALSITTIELTN